MKEQTEALQIANLIHCGDDKCKCSRNLAAKELRRLHARNQELEAMIDSVVAGGVSAQRVTQAADHIAQDRKMVAAQETNDLLARIEKEISTAQINNHRMAAPFGKMEGEPCVRISSLLATIEGFLNEATDALPAAPVVLPEPDEYQYRMKPNWDDKLPWTPWEDCSKESAAIFRKLKEIHNWIYEVRERYTEQQVRELLAAHGITQKKRSNDKEEQQWQ